MGDLATLLAGLDAGERVRGRGFERLCQWVLENEPEYAARLKRVWLWDEWPGRWAAETHAFLWESGRMRDLGTLGGYRSSALAINERGQIVGTSGTADGEVHAFLWEGGKMIDLGTLAGGRESDARAINDKGQVVGWSYATADGREQRAFVWENGKMTALDTLGGHRGEAFAINDKGQIVGWSDTQNGQTHAVLWTPRQGT